MYFCTWVIGATEKDLTLFNISSYSTSYCLWNIKISLSLFLFVVFWFVGLLVDWFGFFGFVWLVGFYFFKFWKFLSGNGSIVPGEGLGNTILWIIVSAIQGQNSVQVIPMQHYVTCSFGACSRNKSAWQEEELQSECDVLGHVLMWLSLKHLWLSIS